MVIGFVIFCNRLGPEPSNVEHVPARLGTTTIQRPKRGPHNQGAGSTLTPTPGGSSGARRTPGTARNARAGRSGLTGETNPRGRHHNGNSPDGGFDAQLRRHEEVERRPYHTTRRAGVLLLPCSLRRWPLGGKARPAVGDVAGRRPGRRACCLRCQRGEPEVRSRWGVCWDVADGRAGQKQRRGGAKRASREAERVGGGEGTGRGSNCKRSHTGEGPSASA